MIRILTIVVLLSFPLRAAQKLPVIEYRGQLNAGAAYYLVKSLQNAVLTGAPMAVLELDLPTGAYASARQVVDAIVSSPIPIVAYAPSPRSHVGRAAQLIFLASHASVLSPDTIFGGFRIGNPRDMKEGQASEPAENTTLAQALAEKRRRKLLIPTDPSGYSPPLAADEAVLAGAADLVAVSRADALSKLATVPVKGVDTPPPPPPVWEEVNLPGPSWWERLLIRFSEPEISYLVFSLGIILIVLKLAYGWSRAYAFLGSLLALSGIVLLQLLQLSYLWLGVLLLGVILMGLEIQRPRYGALALVGVFLFTLGSRWVISDEFGEYQLSMGLIFPVAAVLAMVPLLRSLHQRQSKSLANSILG